MITAAAGRTTAQPALTATNPATHPLAHSDASVLPKRARVMAATESAADPADNAVFTAIRTVRLASTPVKRMAPAPFRPSHPSHAKKQPSKTRTALCPGSADGIPSGLNLPRRGPRIQVMESAVNPPAT